MSPKPVWLQYFSSAPLVSPLGNSFTLNKGQEFQQISDLFFAKHCRYLQVPHSIKPEVQLIELSIIKFVPRVKNRPKIEPPILDPGSVELTVEETLSLRRYIEPHQSASCMWKPSLIAFPHCQLVPTKVHNVRHSGRTISMLIDTLQSLHEFKERRHHDSQVLHLYLNDVFQGC